MGSIASEHWDSDDLLLSLLEAEHEALREFNAEAAEDPFGIDDPKLDGTRFRSQANQILESHDVAFQLDVNSRLIPVGSRVMHTEVVEPTLRLLQGEQKFAAAEAAYLKALVEIRRGDAGDAITDAATALQDTFTALGCKGRSLGALNASAKNKGLLRGNDTSLGEAVDKMVSWVAAQRNNGEAHHGDATTELADAWTVVHMVGALILRLTNSH